MWVAREVEPIGTKVRRKEMRTVHVAGRVTMSCALPPPAGGHEGVNMQKAGEATLVSSEREERWVPYSGSTCQYVKLPSQRGSQVCVHEETYCPWFFAEIANFVFLHLYKGIQWHRY